ncbi:hypothetical protein TrRE_jg6887, partial [Triparma retinervis]
MDDFLAAIYPHYDIVIWSQTSWRWLEVKLTELGFLTSSRWKVGFVLDKTSMFKVRGIVKGRDKEHSVKPLQLIWTKMNTRHSSPSRPL